MSVLSSYTKWKLKKSTKQVIYRNRASKKAKRVVNICHWEESLQDGGGGRIFFNFIKCLVELFPC